MELDSSVFRYIETKQKHFTSLSMLLQKLPADTKQHRLKKCSRVRLYQLPSKTYTAHMRFHVLTAVNMNTVFWGVTRCRLVER
jgi:hypothetical protein